MQYNEKRAKTSGKRVQLLTSIPNFLKCKVFGMLHFPKRHVIWRFQQTIRGFISQKVHCLRVPHAICDKISPAWKWKPKRKLLLWYSLQATPTSRYCNLVILILFHTRLVLRNFAKFTGKHLCQSLFFNKVAATGLQLYLKRDSGTSVFLWVLQNFSEHLLQNISSGFFWY